MKDTNKTDLPLEKISQSIIYRIKKSIKEAMPGAIKTCILIVSITVGISLIIVFFKYFDIMPWIADKLSPIFNKIGLPGEAALAYVSGYFVNPYAAVSVAASLDLDYKAWTILGVMVLCSHNMITETTIQKKTGTSAWRMIIERTASAFILAYILNLVIPETTSKIGTTISGPNTLSLVELLKSWVLDTLKLTIKMISIIVGLSILQKFLAEFGIIKILSKIFSPLLKIFGLDKNTSFLWIISNTLGIAYGAGIILEEAKNGKMNQKEVNLLNTHIAISHSNIEDLILFTTMGGVWYIMLLMRWILSLILVWGYRLQYHITDIIKKQ